MEPTGSIGEPDIQAFLQRIGEKYPGVASLYLLGGGALCLLGNSRRTLDIDYYGHDLPNPADELATTIQSVAQEMRIEIEGVPLDRFIPLPEDAELRHQFIGQYGSISVYVFDPYSIALSKLDRGLETDIQDVVFLIHSGYVSLDLLTKFAEEALRQASSYDILPREFHLHLLTLKKLL